MTMTMGTLRMTVNSPFTRSAAPSPEMIRATRSNQPPTPPKVPAARLSKRRKNRTTCITDFVELLLEAIYQLDGTPSYPVRYRSRIILLVEIKKISHTQFLVSFICCPHRISLLLAVSPKLYSRSAVLHHLLLLLLIEMAVYTSQGDMTPELLKQGVSAGAYEYENVMSNSLSCCLFPTADCSNKSNFSCSG